MEPSLKAADINTVLTNQSHICRVFIRALPNLLCHILSAIQISSRGCFFLSPLAIWKWASAICFHHNNKNAAFAASTSSFTYYQTAVCSFYPSCHLQPEHCNNVLSHYSPPSWGECGQASFKWVMSWGASWNSRDDAASCRTRTADAPAPFSRCSQPSIPSSLCLQYMKSICYVWLIPGAILWWSAVISFFTPTTTSRPPKKVLVCICFSYCFNTSQTGASL